jgi:hypothetical protein
MFYNLSKKLYACLMFSIELAPSCILFTLRHCSADGVEHLREFQMMQQDLQEN